MFKSHPIQVFPFSCLVRTFPVTPPRHLVVTPPNFAYLENVFIRVMQLYLRPLEQRGLKSQQVPTFSVWVSANTFSLIAPQCTAVTKRNLSETYGTYQTHHYAKRCGKIKLSDGRGFKSSPFSVFFKVYFSTFPVSVTRCSAVAT